METDTTLGILSYHVNLRVFVKLPNSCTVFESGIFSDNVELRLSLRLPNIYTLVGKEM